MCKASPVHAMDRHHDKEDNSGAGPAVNDDGFFACVGELFEQDDLESIDQMQRRSSAHSVVVAVKRKRSLETIKMVKRSDLDLTCNICATDAKDSMLKCGHLLCRTCDETWRDSGHSSCPFCRASTISNETDGKDGHVSLELRVELPRRLALRQQFSAANGPIDRHLLRKSVEMETDHFLHRTNSQFGQLMIGMDDYEQEEDLTEEIDLSAAHRVGEEVSNAQEPPQAEDRQSNTLLNVVDSSKIPVPKEIGTLTKPQRNLQANTPHLAAIFLEPQDNDYEVIPGSTHILP